MMSDDELGEEIGERRQNINTAVEKRTAT
jgi:hypothetical protein